MSQAREAREASRLNMKHGFVAYIKRNQVNRDNYDKQVKARAAEQAKQVGHRPNPFQPTRVKKPDRQTYVPPTRLRQPPNGENDMPEDDCPDDFLFRLDYEDQYGELHNLYIHPDDDPALLSRRFGHDQGFTYPMVRAFTDFLQDEIKKCETK